MSEQDIPAGGWQLDQEAPAAYEQYLVPAIFTSWAERLVERAELRDGDRVLDVACGTGVVAREAATRLDESGSVVGLDLNEGMLSVADESANDIQPAIDWRRGDAGDLPFPAASFEVVFCQQALQFFDNPTAALGEMRRVLVSGGQIAVSVWRPLDYQPAYSVLADALDRHVSADAGAMMRSPFPGWDVTDLRRLLRNAEFDTVTVTIDIGAGRYPSVEEFVRREAASSPLAEPIGAVGQPARDELVRDVGEGVSDYVDDMGVVLPMESYVLTASG